MKEPSDVQVLVLEGSSRKRGQIHGEALRPMILEYIAGWKDRLHELVGLNPDEYLEQFLQETSFFTAVKRWTPDLLEEVRGTAEGANVDFETMFAHQLGDEEWWYRREKMFGLSGQGAKGCSGLGVFGQGDSPPLLAQTLDLPDYYDGHMVLLHIKHPESALESFVFTPAGIVASNGLNNQSVGVCANTLFQLNHATDGLPVDFVVRGILAQSTVEDAAAFVRRVKHASGQNYIIGGPKEILDFECSANQVSQFTPYPGANRICHTNHPLANDDQGMYKAALKELSPEAKQLVDRHRSNTDTRLNSLESRTKDPSQHITVETIKTILSSHDSPEHPICRHKGSEGGGMTVAGLIMELSPSPVLHLAPGPPCSTTFKTYTF